ncbi:MAG: hypothetical protein C5B55_02820 [Blastocatellia bacterium]|nr:MAG: hypothetical protein C5B55_02820 [Blastocatellia bacterium]
MKQSRSNERGGATLKFVVVVAILACGAYAGYLYIPVAYHAYVFKDLMQHYADVAATQGYQPTWVSDQLTKSLGEYEIPSDALITPSQEESRVQVRVQYTKAIEFPGYTYQYEFDDTVRSTAFLTFK